jgi:hypothetical protein
MGERFVEEGICTASARPGFSTKDAPSKTWSSCPPTMLR